jgi:predicted  nucleic acid-binding Zn-ribbon protein
MNTITIILIVTAVIVILGSVVYVMAKRLKALNAELKDAKAEIQKQRDNLSYLVKHSEEIAKIRKEEKSVDKAIEEAESNEELFNIINDIISGNNDRVCK